MRAFLFAVLVVALADCGGEARVSKAEYEAQLEVGREAISESFTAVFDRSARLSELEPPRSRSRRSIEKWRLDLARRLFELASEAENAEARLNEAADRLDGTKPPERAKGAHERLVGAVRKLAGDFGEVAEAVRAERWVEDLLDEIDLDKIVTAVEELEAAGYHMVRRVA